MYDDEEHVYLLHYLDFRFKYSFTKNIYIKIIAPETLFYDTKLLIMKTTFDYLCASSVYL